MSKISSRLRYLKISLLLLASFNILTFGAVSYLDSIDPHKAVQLIPYEDGLYVLSRTQLGTYQILYLKDWNALQNYLEKQQLSFLEINDAFPHPNLEAKRKGNTIVWGDQTSPKVLTTPDLESAKQLLLYVQYGSLEPSPLGHAIRLYKKLRS